MTNRNPDDSWEPTACNLCYANCGLLVRTDRQARRILKVKGDRAHPASAGYTCNKAARIDYYQNGRDRLTMPLRRSADGRYEAVDWDTALDAIAGQLAAIRDRHGGDRILYYGGGGQGNHLGGTYAIATRNALRMRYRSNAIAQEKTGLAWVSSRMLGGNWHGDFEHCEVAVIVGKNPWQSNGLQRARVVVRDIGRDPDRTLIVLDPRRSETAELADIHMAVRPGTDVWCISAVLGYLVQQGLANLDWIRTHAQGYERILGQLAAVPVADYARFCDVPMAQIVAAAEAIGRSRRVAVYEDLGVEMSPYSTLCSYLNVLLFVLPGAFGTEGGMYLASGLGNVIGTTPIPPSPDGRDDRGPRTPVTGARIVSGLVPCNSIPEEIVTDHPDRFRALIVESANPVHSLADTARFRQAFAALECSVVIDVAMTETAAVADWVLPAASQYEKCEATFFPMEFPDNFFHLRPPLFEPLPGTLPEAEIHARLVERLGIFDPGELAVLRAAADQGLEAFTAAMLPAMADPRIMRHIPYVLYRTLGPALPPGMAEAASLWGLCQQYAMTNADLVRAAGHEGEGPALGNALFRAILESPSGCVVSSATPGDASQWRMPGGRLNLHLAELQDELDTLGAYRLPERTDEFPLLLCAGERRLYTANTIIRDPDWSRDNDQGALAVHPADAARLGIGDGGRARLVTRRGEAIVQVMLDERMREGTLSLPNGTGLTYPDVDGTPRVQGVYANELTDLEDRDPWVGTPYHKHVRARLEAIS